MREAGKAQRLAMGGGSGREIVAPAQRVGFEHPGLRPE